MKMDGTWGETKRSLDAFDDIRVSHHRAGARSVAARGTSAAGPPRHNRKKRSFPLALRLSPSPRPHNRPLASWSGRDMCGLRPVGDWSVHMKGGAGRSSPREFLLPVSYPREQ
jgi:hypothetical protein